MALYLVFHDDKLQIKDQSRIEHSFTVPVNSGGLKICIYTNKLFLFLCLFDNLVYRLILL